MSRGHHPWLRQSVLRVLRAAGEAGATMDEIIRSIYGNCDKPSNESRAIQKAIRTINERNLAVIITSPPAGRKSRRFLRERDNP